MSSCLRMSGKYKRAIQRPISPYINNIIFKRKNTETRTLLLDGNNEFHKQEEE